MIEGLKPAYNAMLSPLSSVLARLGIHPNAVTVAGVLLFGISGYFTATGEWIVAFVFLAAGSFLDGLDGVLARQANKRSTFGAILDSTCDRLTEILWFGGLMVFYVRNPSHCPGGLPLYLAAAALTGSLMVSYVKARAEGVGVACNPGILQRPERIVLIGLSMLLGKQVMPWGLALIAALSWATVAQRIAVAYRGASGRREQERRGR